MSNNPIKLTDPTGHKCVGDDEGCIAGGGGTGSVTVCSSSMCNPNDQSKKLKEEFEEFDKIPTFSKREMKNIILIPGTAEGTQAFNPAELDLFRDENGDIDRFKLLTYAMLSKSAKNTAQSMFPNDVTNDGPRNAFQHTYWNALLVGQFGSEFTEAITNAHEQNFDAVRETQFMDLRNNELGRNIATANPGLTGMALIAQVYVAVVGGQAIALNKNKNRFDVYFSNECPAC